MNGKFVTDAMSGEEQPSNELLDMIGGRLELVARLGDGDSGSVLFRTRMAPGQLVPLHSHIDPECFYVLSGRLEAFLVDAAPGWRQLPAGRSVLITNGFKHAIRNSADDPADLIVMTNGRLARFFRESGLPGRPGTDFEPAGPEDVQRVLQTAKAYGYWMSSPAEHAAGTGASVSAKGR